MGRDLLALLIHDWALQNHLLIVVLIPGKVKLI